MSSPERKDVKDSVRHFTPAWFAINMGTGAISILFAGFPYGSNSLVMQAFAATFFFLNLILFLVFTLISAYRYIRYPDIWNIMIRHPVQSLYLGCFPMGAATLISVGVNIFYSDFGFGGPTFLYLLWAFWWLDVVVSAVCVFLLVHVMFTTQQHDLSRMTSVWLLPVVTFIVASSTGVVLASPIYALSPYHAHITLMVSVWMVSIGLSLALMILTIYLFRLVVHGLPEGASIISSFVPLGPTGQSGFALLLIGQACTKFFPFEGSSSSFLGGADTGRIINVGCICLSLFLWSIATMWLLFALLGVFTVVRRSRFPFRVPFWGMIFPNGVYANHTINIYRALDVEFFRVWGALYAAITLALWVVVFSKTVVLVRHGYIFEAPCLEGINLGASDGLRGVSGLSTPATLPQSIELADRSRRLNSNR
ncbi:voltage-dependent anion channel [Vararia minispora EC-137]|uniref:Voltage-dependent anion channel n=1 Tax=Vararia minispora EC-137 TaxID=1314806 RepID=A0ACB8QK79_9AGAM|nr:voltage-dependent anion channel [Vararia minispora EC-137]